MNDVGRVQLIEHERVMLNQTESDLMEQMLVEAQLVLTKKEGNDADDRQKIEFGFHCEQGKLKGVVDFEHFQEWNVLDFDFGDFDDLD